MKNPRSREMMWAGSTFSVEVKKTDRMMLKPANTQPVNRFGVPFPQCSAERVFFTVEYRSDSSRSEKHADIDRCGHRSMVRSA